MCKSKYITTVVIATGTMNAGGTETLIMEMLRHASGRVRYIMLIHHDGNIQEGIFDSEIRKLGIEMYYIPSVGSLGIKGYIKAFSHFVESLEVSIDIIHSHLNGAGGIISLAAKKMGIRHRICHCHADIHFTGGIKARLMNEIKLAAMKLMIEFYATDRWACSQTAWKRLFLPWHKQVVIDNMIDTKCYLATDERRYQAKKRFGVDCGKVVGAVGRVFPIKNYEIILRAMEGTDWHFVCFGRFDMNDKYCASLNQMAQNLGISDRVHWMGNSNNVAEDIHCIDVFVMPSFTEGFGMAAIEAQAAGLPCLLSTGVPSIVDMGLGLVSFIDPDQPLLWKKSIEKIAVPTNLDNREIVGRFIEKGFDSVEGVKKIEDKYLFL